MIKIHLLLLYLFAEPLEPFQHPHSAELPKVVGALISIPTKPDRLDTKKAGKEPNYTKQCVGMGKILPIPPTWQSAFLSATQESQQLAARRG